MKHCLLFASSLLILALTYCKNNSQVLESKIATSSEQQTSFPEKFNNEDYEFEDLSTWKTYKNQTITFKYPNNFSISNEVIDEKGVSTMCVIADGEDLLNLCITYASSLSFKYYSESDVKGDVENFREGMKKYYSDITMSDISKTCIGTFDGFIQSYQATLSGVKIKGDNFVAYKDNHMLVLMTQAEYQQNTEILRQIMKTISFCK